MKFTLTCIDSDGTRSEKQFDSNYDKTSDFLQGVGFVFDELEVKMPSDYEDSSPYDYDQLLKDKVSFIRTNRINNK